MELGFERPEELPNSIGVRIYLESLEPKNSFRLGRTEWYSSLQLDVAGLWHDGLVAAQYELSLGTNNSAAAIAKRDDRTGKKIALTNWSVSRRI